VNDQLDALLKVAGCDSRLSYDVRRVATHNLEYTSRIGPTLERRARLAHE